MKKELTEIKKYDTFIYNRYEINKDKEYLKISYYYEIPNLRKFVHKIEVPYSIKAIDDNYLKTLVFNIGMLELVSYYKATMANKIIVKCGSLDKKQEDFFRKVYYYGLGEFAYLNKLDLNYDSYVELQTSGEEYKPISSYQGNGKLIAIGGGKDSCVTLSLVSKNDNGCFIINPKPVMMECAYVKGYQNEDIYTVKRIIDKELLSLNDEGFLNGHTPFSAMVAFVSYLTAYLNGKKEIVLSNESSANEANVSGTKINHQYSKSYEFENDFQKYAKEYLGGDIKYYSFLRPLTEYQIGMLFARYREFHPIFKSCNHGSKESPWQWCCNCAKCLFVYSLLAPYLYKEELVNIFHEDLFMKESLLDIFLELLGKKNVKPFDCVGTFTEVNYAITKTIKKWKDTKLPTLLQYYKDNYYDEEILNLDLEHSYNDENSLSNEDIDIIKEAISNDK